MSECIFCQIAKNELPAVKIYEDDKFVAFLDLRPVSIGHALVIPKEHHTNILDTPEELVSGLVVVVKKIVLAILKVTGAESFNLGVNNGPDAGQLIWHTHFHIIPRFAEDGLKNWPQRKNYNEGEMEKIGEAIRQNI